jgi:hypothetical protein
VPGLVATNCPCAFTFATSGSDEAKAMLRPESVVLSLALRMTVSDVVVPATGDAESGVIDTAATAGRTTATCVVADLSSTVAVIIAAPGVTPVTTPFATVATAALDVDQVGVFPVIAAPDASRMSATSVSVAPTCSAPLAPDSVSDATTGPDGLTGPVARLPSPPHARLDARRTAAVTMRIEP